ncbi:MAG: UDP-4-amino-4,6-dideoxy-N-acetyl-beta-L-altrosamine transaminase [Acidimicrobiales bacterium]|nr:MAG: UDP-4-amino-4,6-dideoxy-N-acetyl-beta-L-altrosamine transaminase [Acidimicrobiales bacterium]
MNASWLPYGRQWIDDSDIEAVTAVLRGDWLTTGPAVAEFEAAIQAAVGAPAVSVTSGTAALHAAYAGLGLGPGDEVITTPMTFIATASAAAMTGARIKFADISPDTANIDPAAVEPLLSSRTAVIAGVDYAGHPMDVDALRVLTERVGAVLLEDAAHSIGGSYQGRPVGSLADITTFSFFPSKNLTSAEGGAVVATQPDLLAEIRRFARIGRNLNRDELRHSDEGEWWYEMSSFGLNYRLPDVLCALGISQLKRLSTFVERRRELVAAYNELLSGLPDLTLPTQRDGVSPAWHLYAVRVRNGRRREAFEKLRAAGIGVQVNYIPVYWHPVFADSGYRRGMCPVAEKFYAEQLSLPLYPAMSEADQLRVVEALTTVLV